MKILNSLKNIYEKKNIEKREYPEFDIEAYKEVAGISDFIENKDISKTLKLALGVFGVNGIYLFFVTKDTHVNLIKESVQSAIKKLDLLIPNITIFVRADELDYYYNGSALIEKKYLLDCFTNIYKNTQLSSMTLQSLNLTDDQLMEKEYPEQDQGWYVANRVSENQLELIYNKISEYIPSVGNAKEITVDGVKFSRHAVKTKIFGYSYAEQYFPVSTTDPIKFMLITLFGGIIGIHKLITKEYGKFLLYLVTFGGLGVLYVLDVISIASGGYYINQVDYDEDDYGKVNKTSTRLYLDKLQRIPLQIASVVISIALAFGCVRFVYFSIVHKASYKLTMFGVEKVQEMNDTYTQEAHDMVDTYTEGSEQ